MKNWLGVALVLFAAPLHAQAPTSFREGVLAFEKQEWSKAERLMRETIAANPTESEGTVSIAGQWFETYVPHYFLARALARQGKCAEALTAFAETERQGISPAIEDFARHLKTRGGCKGSREISIDVPLAGGTLPPKPRATTSSTPIPPKKTPPITPPKSIAPAPPPKTPPSKPAVLDAGTRAWLTTALTAYLRGQYADSVRLLSGKEPSDRDASAHAALIRAAAQHALYRMGGEQDASLRDAAVRELARYRSLLPGGRPDPRLFPPSLIALANEAQTAN